MEAFDVVQTHTFLSDWSHLGLSDDDLQGLENLIMERPDACRVISGTGGLRKIRFAPRRWRKGKRGSVRVCFAYFPLHQVVFLFSAFAKNEAADFPVAHKKAYRKLIESIEHELAEKKKRSKPD